MKCGKLKSVVEHLQPIYASLGRAAAHEALIELAKLLALTPDATVAQLSKSISKLQCDSHSTGDGNVREALKIFASIGPFLEVAGKPAVIKDVKVLASSLETHANGKFDYIIEASGSSKKPAARAAGSPARSEVVQAYLRSLEQALGDENGFAQAFLALEKDREVRPAEAIALAKLFAFTTVKSRPAALKKIWGRHQALMTSRAKAAATAGRIAG